MIEVDIYLLFKLAAVYTRFNISERRTMAGYKF
jgi:hypothetical protein